MKESEAYNYWCPEFREGNRRRYQYTSSSFIPKDGHDFCCIGSACAAWRWNKEPTAIEVNRVRLELNLSLPEAIKYCQEHQVEFTDGYCGKAGKE